MGKQLKPVAIHRTAGLILWDDGSVTPILYSFDCHGEQTTPNEGVAFVAHDLNGKWHSIDGSQYVAATVH